MTIHQKSLLKILFTVFALAAIAGCAAPTRYLKLESSLQKDVTTLNGFQYIPLARLCDVYGINCRWDTFVRTATIQKNSNTIILRSGSERTLVNGKEESLDRPVLMSGGVVFVPVSFARNNLRALVGTKGAVPVEKAPMSVEAGKKFTIKKIIIDTGHGGKDVGAIGRRMGTREKDLALTLARKIGAILETQGISVTMTRGDDIFIPLPKRAEIANRSGADIFMSVHINASRSRLMRGFECYYLSNATDDNARALEAFEDLSLKLGDGADVEHSTELDRTLWDMALTENRMESAELASYICESVEDSLSIKNRGVRTARFYVLKHTHLPAVLVEAGYISNRYEEMKLKDPKFLDRLAEAIARGVLRYKERYEKTEGFTSV